MSLALAFGLAAAISASDLIELTDLHSLSVSPDGKLAVVATRRADLAGDRYRLTRRVVAVDTGRTVLEVPDGSDPILNEAGGGASTAGFADVPAVWSPDGRRFAFRNRAGDVVEAKLVDMASGSVRTVRLPDGDVDDLAWTRTGARLLVSSDVGRTGQQRADEAAARVGWRFDERFVPFAKLGPVRYGPPRTQVVLAVDPVSGVEEAPPAEPAPVAAGARFQLEDLPGQLGLQRSRRLTYRGEDGSVTHCAAAACQGWLRSLWSRDQKSVVFERRDGPQHEVFSLYAWNPTAPAARLLVHTLDQVTDCQQGATEMVCFEERALQPRRLIAFDLRTGRRRILLDPNPGFAGFEPPRWERLSIPVLEGEETYGILMLPSREPLRDLPLVITTYECGGFLRGGTGDEYPMRLLVRHGFAVLCFNAPRFDRVRREARSAEELNRRLSGLDRFQSRHVQAAVDRAVAGLVARGLVDRNRVAMTGLSYGSEMTHWALLHMHPLAAAITSGPGLDPSYMTLGGVHTRSFLEGWGYASPYDREAWSGVAVAMNAARVSSPLLINAASTEYLLATPEVMELRDAGKPVELYVFPGEGHVKIRPAHRAAIYERNLDWLRFWLKDEEDPAPAKAEQYARWRGMRASGQPAPRTP